jgi:hypothetical protein
MFANRQVEEFSANRKVSIRARLQSLLKNSLEGQEVSGHEFTRAVKGFFTMSGFSRRESFSKR